MRLDHINVHTDDLESVKRVFMDILCLTEGERPPSSKPGHWLYGEGHPVVHLSAAEGEDDTGSTGALNHVAFYDEDFDGLIARLEKAGIAHEKRAITGSGVRQVFFRISHGIKIEVDFAPEAAMDEA